MSAKIVKTTQEWRETLSPKQFRITRQGGTEPAFTGNYHDFKGVGIYKCVCCDSSLFDSQAKYDSGSGWPSFYQALTPDKLSTKKDISLGMSRTEVLCSHCDAHLGHVFPDGPLPTGQRYCMNSAALSFQGQNQADTP